MFESMRKEPLSACVCGVRCANFGTERNNRIGAQPQLYSISIFVHQHFSDHRLSVSRPPTQDGCERIQDRCALAVPRSTPRSLTSHTFFKFWTAMISLSHNGAALVYLCIHSFSTVSYLLTPFLPFSCHFSYFRRSIHTRTGLRSRRHRHSVRTTCI